MKVIYDREFDILELWDGAEETSAPLRDHPDIVVHLGVDEREVVGLAVTGAFAYLSLVRGYDVDRDALTFGAWPDAPDHRTQNRDWMVCWYRHPEHPNDPREFLEPVGVVLAHASKHLASVLQ